MRIRLSKTRVFERYGRDGKTNRKNGLNVSQNLFLILASQKLKADLSFERYLMAKKTTGITAASLKEGRVRPAARKSAKAKPSRRTDGEVHPKGMLIGYARVSTVDQNLALQRDALNEAGCGKIFTEQMSGAVADRPALHDALEFARSGDTLVVWKLDRLARSMKQLIETIEKLRIRNIGFRSLTEALDTTTAQGLLVFHMFSALAEF